MNVISNILKISFTFVFAYLSYAASFRASVKNRKVKFGNLYLFNKNSISYFCVVILALIFSFYSISCSSNGNISDRSNYALRFENGMDYYFQNNSYGLYMIVKFLHIFTNNSAILFASISFIYILLTMIAYRYAKEATPITLLLMGVSLYYIYSFYLLKQCIAVAIVSIAITAFLKKKWQICFPLTLLAVMFHESAFIMFPIYIIIVLSGKGRIRRSFVIILLCALLLFYNKIISFSFIALKKILPSIVTQFEVYINENGSIESENNLWTIFKGIPFYIITVYALYFKKKLEKKINNYNKYLTISCVCSTLILLSWYSYWMWRFAIYCYFPVYIFASLIYINDDNEKNRKLFLYLLIFIYSILTIYYMALRMFKYGGF